MLYQTAEVLKSSIWKHTTSCDNNGVFFVHRYNFDGRNSQRTICNSWNVFNSKTGLWSQKSLHIRRKYEQAWGLQYKAWFILHANANANANFTCIWRHNLPLAAIFVSWAKLNCCEFFVANLWRQHSYRIRTWGWRGWAPGMTSELFEHTGGRPGSTHGS